MGRQAELRRIADYVEVLPPGTRLSAARRRLRRVLGLREKPPLVVHGPGGIGKSTLMARFVLDHAEQDGGLRFPFAYLTFDRIDLDPHEPLTLLAEATRQLGAQFPGVAADAEGLERLIHLTLRRQSSVKFESEGSWAPSRRAMKDAAVRDDATLLERYGGLVAQALDGREEPLLWVLDTFEQAQRQGGTAEATVWEFLDELQGVHPRLRVVFAGRAPLEARPVDDLPLLGFDDELAVAFLRSHLADLDVDERFLHVVAKRVQRNPLSLKLAAELLRREGEEALREVTTKRRVLLGLGAEEIQGTLYRRILDHLEDDDLRRLANPGLVLRRITPEVIQHVLATPCGLGDVDAYRARKLHELLAQEASLVTRIGDALVHRADVRQVMLPMVERDDPETVAGIHRRAIDFYAADPGFEARVEELYHRLAVGQRTSTLDRHWHPDAASLLEEELDNLPASSQVYLATKLGRTIERATLEQADGEAWARQVRRSARESLDADRPDEALEILRSRGFDAYIPDVTMLEVEALAVGRQFAEALEVTHAGLERASQEGDDHAFVELSLLGARIAEEIGDVLEADTLVSEAQKVAEGCADGTLTLSADVVRLRLCRRTGLHPEIIEALQDRVVKAARKLTRRQRTRNPSLVRDLAAEVGDTVPELLLEATRVHGLDIAGSSGRALDEVLSSDEIDDFRRFVGAPPVEDGSPPTMTTLVGEWVQEEQSEALVQFVQSAFTSPEHGEHWKTALVRAHRAAVDTSAFVAEEEAR